MSVSIDAHPDSRVADAFAAALSPLSADPQRHSRALPQQYTPPSVDAPRNVVDALFGAAHEDDGLGVPDDACVSVAMLRSRANYLTGRCVSPRSWRRFVCCLQGASERLDDLLPNKHHIGSDDWMDDVEVTHDNLMWLAACGTTCRAGVVRRNNNTSAAASPRVTTTGRHELASPSMSPHHHGGSVAASPKHDDAPSAVDEEPPVSTMEICGVTVPVAHKHAAGANVVVIDKADVRAAFQQLGYGISVLDDETFDILVAGADADGDGALTPDEFALLLTSFGEDGAS